MVQAVYWAINMPHNSKNTFLTKHCNGDTAVHSFLKWIINYNGSVFHRELTSALSCSTFRLFLMFRILCFSFDCWTAASAARVLSSASLRRTPSSLPTMWVTLAPSYKNKWTFLLGFLNHWVLSGKSLPFLKGSGVVLQSLDESLCDDETQWYDIILVCSCVIILTSTSCFLISENRSFLAFSNTYWP